MSEDVLWKKAFKFAKEKHKGQVDDDGKDYFTTHCLQTYNLLCEISDSNILHCAGLLHDTLEDTDATYEQLKKEFGYEIADLVLEVTQEGNQSTGYFFPRLHSKEGIMLKFADRLSNLSRMRSWNGERRKHYLKRSCFWKKEKVI